MNKPVIAVDIDEVLASNAPSFIEYTNKKWGLNLTIDDYHEHWAELWGVDHEETRRRAAEYNLSGVVEVMPHKGEAVDVLKQLAKGYTLVITTARHRELTDITKKWIDTYYQGIFSDIHHVGIWDTAHPHANTFTKADICQQIGASFLIDDQSKHCNAVQEAEIQAIMFGDYSWNRNDEIVEGVVRCGNWDAVLEYFNARS